MGWAAMRITNDPEAKKLLAREYLAGWIGPPDHASRCMASGLSYETAGAVYFHRCNFLVQLGSSTLHL